MHEVWRGIVIRNHRVECLSIIRKEVAMIRERVVPGKHDMVDLMLALKEAKINAEDIPVHMHKRQNATKKLKDKG